MFEQASRLKLRFAYKGNLSVEDLWDLPFAALDEIFRNLSKEAQEKQEATLAKPRAPLSPDLALKIQMVTHIYEVKTTEQQEREKISERASQKKELLEIIAEKEKDGLKSMPIDKLKKLAARL